MDDFLGNLVFDRRLQVALDPQVDWPPQLLLEVAPQSEEIAQGLIVRTQFDGDIDVGTFLSLCPRIAAEEADARHSEALFQLLLATRQKVYDIVTVSDHG